MANEWTTIRIKTARKDAVAARAKSEGLSAAEWLERTLAAALSRDGASPASEAHGSPVKATPTTPQRAPDDGPNLRAIYAGERQAKLNAEKARSKR